MNTCCCCLNAHMRRVHHGISSWPHLSTTSLNLTYHPPPPNHQVWHGARCLGADDCCPPYSGDLHTHLYLLGVLLTRLDRQWMGEPYLQPYLSGSTVCGSTCQAVWCVALLGTSGWPHRYTDWAHLLEIGVLEVLLQYIINGGIFE